MEVDDVWTSIFMQCEPLELVCCYPVSVRFQSLVTHYQKQYNNTIDQQTTTKVEWKHAVMNEAARAGMLEILQPFSKNGYEITWQVILTTLKASQLAVVDWIFTMSILTAHGKDNMLHEAIFNDDIPLLLRLRNNGCVVDDLACQHIVRHGRLEMFKVLYQDELTLPENIYAIAAMIGQTSILEFFQTEGLLHDIPYLICVAEENCQHETVAYLQTLWCSSHIS
jgi:hypothetical protein